MDSGYVALFLAVCGVAWFAISSHIDKKDLERENERLKEKIGELKEFIKDSK